MLLGYRPEGGGSINRKHTDYIGVLKLIYSPNCYVATTVYINSLLSDRGRAVYEPIVNSYRVRYN